jgi:LemA protein
MKKGTITWLSILGVIVILFFWGMGEYNKLVKADEQLTKAWSNVESQYQRRSDLIPNLVQTVKGYTKYESTTLTAVVEARAKASQTVIDPSQLTEENLARFQQAQSAVGSALNRLLVTVEKYPDLKASQQFLELQAQLEGTENRISVERQRYNEAARSYNTMIRQFPRNILASLFGFEKKAYFEAAAGTEKAPVVSFTE